MNNTNFNKQKETEILPDGLAEKNRTLKPATVDKTADYFAILQQTLQKKMPLNLLEKGTNNN